MISILIIIKGHNSVSIARRAIILVLPNHCLHL